MKAKCNRTACISNKPGLWEPIILLWPVGRQPGTCPPASINIVGVVVCDDCIKIARVRDFIPNQKEWEKIENIFNAHSKVKPSWVTAKMSYVMPETHYLKDTVLV